MTKKKSKANKASSAKKAPRKVSTKAKSRTIIATKTAIHGFDNGEILVLQQSLLIAKAFEQNASREFSHNFLQILSKSVPTYSTQTFTNPAYRIVPPGKQNLALDDKGTFAAGGRVNIGMKQQDPLFTGPISYAYGGIYCSKEASTAQREFESVAPGAFDLAELNHATSKFTLIDFDAVVRDFDLLLFPESLSARINSAPFHGSWKFQPFPLASQILGNWLRLHAGEKADGLFFRSTKDPQGTNFFIFSPHDWVIN
jgi:hypothetical protein